jgi:hypothetical protein
VAGRWENSRVVDVLAASDVPLWSALLVGLAGGVLGTLVGTLLTISHERGAEFRTRMLSAADDFLRTATQLAQSIGTAQSAIASKEPDEQVEPLMRAFRESSSRLVIEYSRIQLLFGAESRAFRSAVEAVEAVDKVRQALRSMWREPGSVTPQRFEEAFDRAAFEIGRFGQDARRDIRQTAVGRRLGREEQRALPPTAQAPPPAP